MLTNALRIAAAIMLTVALWMVPSAVTQGQGTLGGRFDHADNALIANHQLLSTGDATAAAAVTGL